MDRQLSRWCPARNAVSRELDSVQAVRRTRRIQLSMMPLIFEVASGVVGANKQPCPLARQAGTSA